MAGGKELDELSAVLEEFARTDATGLARASTRSPKSLHREAESLHGH